VLILKRTGVIGLWLLLIFSTAVVTAAYKQRFEDGPNRVFSGGPLIAGELYRGAEPDWAFVNDVSTLELQLLSPAQSRRIWVASVQGKMYVWSGYMNSFVGQIWKSWPAQAERDARVVVRIDGIRYERRLVRIKTGAVLDELMAVVSKKYPSRSSGADVESGNVWVFEVAPRAAADVAEGVGS
jgi:hypothetical protein|tara:strand:+ start:4514 stop:5062 length:549 start_codon:yes stop_codon:yes gene_type:complete